MQPLRTFSVFPKLPKQLEPLWILARNYWFAWNHGIEALFADIDPEMWKACDKNPVWMLNHASQSSLNHLSEDPLYLERLNRLVSNLETYLNSPPSYSFEDTEPGKPAIAYFSFEFGISPCLPIYSGGLGILAGDHLKSASDLNIPLVGIGLAYAQGYFRQYMTPDGWQQEKYPDYDFNQMPLSLVKDKDGKRLTITINLGNEPLSAQIWEANVGRIKLLLLDTNIAENREELRSITARLYGGNLEMRLRQEILLGIGGLTALAKLGRYPKVIHMNEGHSAFAVLERVRLLIKESGLTFEVAVEVAASGSIFTTHTPVPAGNDRFPPDLMHKYFEAYAKDMGLAFKVFMALGRENPHDDNETFCMTVLALRLSVFNNGVSKLHGRVSRHMWRKVWPQFPEDDVPIGSNTNGIHAPTWVAKDMSDLFDQYLGSTWREDPDNDRIWAQAANIPDWELWRVHEKLRERLVDFVRRKMRDQCLARGMRQKDILAVESILNPKALTIGFARRFATYKRAQLLLQDKESLLRIIGNKERPVQFIFAGKAHPQDQDGKRLMQEIITVYRSPEFRMNMIFLEDYDMDIAAHLISGCDVWLNNPRRPLEACGTSGMKAVFNGVMQFSTLDGWWDEAWKPDNSLGWAIGKGEEYENQSLQDAVELKTLYKILESEIIPDFYDRENGNLPFNWIKRMRDALVHFGPRFQSNRMVQEYLHTSYIPACKTHHELYKGGFAPAKELNQWRMGIMTKWDNLVIKDVRTSSGEPNLHVGQPVSVTAKVFLADIKPEHLRLDIYMGTVGQDNSFSRRKIKPMQPDGPVIDGWQIYKGEFTPKEPGKFGFTVRAMPSHPLLPAPHSIGLVRWAAAE